MESGRAATMNVKQRGEARAARRRLPWWRRLWEGWKRVAEAIGNFNARLLLTLFYLVFVAPLAIGLRLFADPLRLKRTSKSYWSPLPEHTHDMEEAKRQFS